MYDELKLPLTWWTSDWFRDLRTQRPTIGPAVKRMYDDMVAAWIVVVVQFNFLCFATLVARTD